MDALFRAHSAELACQTTRIRKAAASTHNNQARKHMMSFRARKDGSMRQLGSGHLAGGGMSCPSGWVFATRGGVYILAGVAHPHTSPAPRERSTNATSHPMALMAARRTRSGANAEPILSWKQGARQSGMHAKRVRAQCQCTRRVNNYVCGRGPHNHPLLVASDAARARQRHFRRRRARTNAEATRKAAPPAHPTSDWLCIEGQALVIQAKLLALPHLKSGYARVPHLKLAKRLPQLLQSAPLGVKLEGRHSLISLSTHCNGRFRSADLAMQCNIIFKFARPGVSRRSRSQSPKCARAPIPRPPHGGPTCGAQTKPHELPGAPVASLARRMAVERRKTPEKGRTRSMDRRTHRPLRGRVHRRTCPRRFWLTNPAIASL